MAILVATAHADTSAKKPASGIGPSTRLRFVARIGQRIASLGIDDSPRSGPPGRGGLGQTDAWWGLVHRPLAKAAAL